MKLSVIAAVLIGGLIGSAVTYRLSCQAGRSEPKSQSSPPHAETQIPFDDAEDDKEPDDYFRLLLTDPTDQIQRDMVIAMWYANEVQTVDYLRVNTGHEFGPVWNQRSPVEILEEQLKFWKDYLAESARLEEVRRTKRMAEQAAPSNH